MSSSEETIPYSVETKEDRVPEPPRAETLPPAVATSPGEGRPPPTKRKRRKRRKKGVQATWGAQGKRPSASLPSTTTRPGKQ